MTVQLPQAHKAVLVATGWASRKEDRDLVAGIWVRALPAKLHGTRVTVRLYGFRINLIGYENGKALLSNPVPTSGG